MSVFILKDKPIALIKELKALVVTDLHIGIENELRKKGINIPSQVEKFFEIIRKAKEETNAEVLIILGDLKHKVPGSSIRELENVKLFIKKTSELMEVKICKGNHDDLIEKIVEEIDKNVEVYGARGVKIGNYGFFHGHAWPYSYLWEAETWVVGHLQAFVELSFGPKRNTEKVFIKGFPRMKRGNLKEIIVLPSLNDFAGGINIVKERPTGLLFEKIVSWEKCEVYLLNGSFLGTLKEVTKQ